MKKIIILLVVLSFTSACYDYKEINDLAVINAIGIDYQDEKYIVTLEVLNDKIDKNSSKITSYTKKGSGKTLTEAIEASADKLENQAYYNHIKLMIISKEIAENKFKTIIDFFLRNTYFRENFYLVSSLSTSPEDLLENTGKINPIASNNIIKMLENNKYSSNIAVLKTFDKIIEEVITFGIDTSFSNITINDNEFKIDGLTVFHNETYQGLLDNNIAKIYNILNDEYYRPSFSAQINDVPFSISLLTGKPNVTITKNQINISGNVQGKILDNASEIDIKNTNNLEKINAKFTKSINEEFTNFFKIVQKSNADILGLSRQNYIKTRHKNNSFWHHLNVSCNIKFTINKKGLIYEVKDEN